MQNIILPQELLHSLGSEKRDFAVKSNRAQPLIKSLSLIIFGSIWTLFTGIFMLFFLTTSHRGIEINFQTGGLPEIIIPKNFEPFLFFSVIIGVFVIIGLSMIFWGTYSVFKKGGYFVGTPTRLVHFQNGKIRSIDWEQFSGDIVVQGTPQKGTISLQMRTGKMVSRKNGRDRYVPEEIYISQIADAYNIEQFCRRRIKENDPTPPPTF